uniref:eS1 SB0 n=1 Tax=Spraguea lophii (strain 42_110) TaxID=1358809 RepID=UPI0022656F54|nr:Chain SB0, eS1 SB0 [Spraguea lophii 42_110]7QJH_RB0 Chain RB0, eS1 [Spraguea lophii 42_110]7QJH_SB0 Chain SB0, eS1 [Spraguea lophii 42_110]8BR3_SB0 Chain SB0, eS1 [Spraguea lophii 42_110]8P5D_SB0 Chain SB0, eS1 [Spraguea lophii 42_110]8P60_RB0 Chain RB0, 40S ribosomal protein S1 [Spraguea lophii 42_110]8P60_SB0 Chain SB0, 40S ribosomal protein S1 [Spraguea lophii 42_110]
MAIKADNPKMRKGMKKGGKKKVEKDSFLKKEKYNLRIENFPVREVGATLVNKQSTVAALEKKLVGRVFEANQGDITTSDSANCYRKFSFKIDSLAGTNAHAIFNGMCLTSEKIKGMVKRGLTLIEGVKDVVTKEGITLRILTIAQSKKEKNSTKKTAYAKTSVVKEVRKNIFRIVDNELNGKDIEQIVKKLQMETVGKEIEKECQKIIPLQNCHVLKVKVVKRPVKEEVE